MAKNVVLFTQQLIGHGTRKTGMVFWAEAFARAGWATSVVSTQLSWLSRLSRSSKIHMVKKGALNVWMNVSERLQSFVWVPPLHPIRSRLDAITAGLLPGFGLLLPKSVKERLRSADIIVVESCSAVALLPVMLRRYPSAKVVYCASDRLDAVGMHAGLQPLLNRYAERLALIRIPAALMRSDFPPDSRVLHVPHGVDKEELGSPTPRPFPSGGKHVLVAGDMMFDVEAMRDFASLFPEATFHLFGKAPAEALAPMPNIRNHGEVPFKSLIPFLQHCDAGIAPYLPRPEVAYLTQSSLKLLQYDFCGLPVVVPDFIRDEDRGHFGYGAALESRKKALEDALAAPKNHARADSILDWDQVVQRVLQAIGELPSPGDRTPA